MGGRYAPLYSALPKQGGLVCAGKTVRRPQIVVPLHIYLGPFLGQSALLMATGGGGKAESTASKEVGGGGDNGRQLAPQSYIPANYFTLTCEGRQRAY